MSDDAQGERLSSKSKRLRKVGNQPGYLKYQHLTIEERIALVEQMRREQHGDASSKATLRGAPLQILTRDAASTSS